jgi:hypothetical protein
MVISHIEKNVITNVEIKLLRIYFQDVRDFSIEEVKKFQDFSKKIDIEAEEIIPELFKLLKFNLSFNLSFAGFGILIPKVFKDDKVNSIFKMMSKIQDDIVTSKKEGTHVIYLLSSDDFSQIPYKDIPFENRIMF